MPAHESPRPVVVMGVSGSGKSTVGTALASALGRPFVDADDLHPAANRDKMAAGIPLDDTDREPWLDAVGARIVQLTDAGTPPVVACSALKRSYRDRLRTAAPTLVFAHLDGDRDTLVARIGARSHEFMPASLLDSQLEALQPLADSEPGFRLPLSGTVDEIVAAAAADLQAMGGQP